MLSLSLPWPNWPNWLPVRWLSVAAAAPVEPATVQGVSALGSSANQNFIANAAFVVTEHGVVVIDAPGSPPLAQRLLVEIRKRTAQPVNYKPKGRLSIPGALRGMVDLRSTELKLPLCPDEGTAVAALRNRHHGRLAARSALALPAR